MFKRSRFVRDFLIDPKIKTHKIKFEDRKISAR